MGVDLVVISRFVCCFLFAFYFTVTYYFLSLLRIVERRTEGGWVGFSSETPSSTLNSPMVILGTIEDVGMDRTGAPEDGMPLFGEGRRSGADAERMRYSYTPLFFTIFAQRLRIGTRRVSIPGSADGRSSARGRMRKVERRRYEVGIAI